MISLCMGSQHTLPYVDVVYKNGRGKVAMLFSTKSLAWSHLSFPHIEPILIGNWPTEILNALVLMFFCRYERFEVLAVFASTILAQFGALFIVKERLKLTCSCYSAHSLLIGSTACLLKDVL